MEMIFPHKSLTQTSAETDAPASSAHDVLIAHAIARQSLSPSARAYLTRHSDLAALGPRENKGFMEDRIRLLQDVPHGEGRLQRASAHILDRIYCARIHQAMQLRSKYERLIYLGNLVV